MVTEGFMARQDDYFVITAPGLEKICAAEIQQLGISATVSVAGGVEFSGGLRELYLVNLWSRTASRVLVRLGEVSARDFPALYQKLSKLPWGRFVKPGQRCNVKVTCHTSRLNHSGRIAQTCNDAIMRVLRQDADGDQATATIYLRFVEDRCLVSVDSSGVHLHRRGYRQVHGAAPLRETLAAGSLLACGYDGSQPLIDLMTGSGTFALEAAMIALRRAPGLKRDFAFMDWPKFRAGLWQQLGAEAQRQQKKALAAPIIAVDNNPKVIAVAEANLIAGGLTELIDLRCCAMQDLVPEGPDGLLICNPPYGERLGRNAVLSALYRDLGRVYGEVFKDWQGGVLCPDNSLLKASGLNLQQVLRLSNGGIMVGLFMKRS